MTVALMVFLLAACFAAVIWRLNRRRVVLEPGEWVEVVRDDESPLSRLYLCRESDPPTWTGQPWREVHPGRCGRFDLGMPSEIDPNLVVVGTEIVKDDRPGHWLITVKFATREDAFRFKGWVSDGPAPQAV